MTSSRFESPSTSAPDSRRSDGWLIFRRLLWFLGPPGFLMGNLLSPTGLRFENEFANFGFFLLVLGYLPSAFVRMGRVCDSIVLRTLIILPGSLLTLFMGILVVLLAGEAVSSGRVPFQSDIVAEWPESWRIYKVLDSRTGAIGQDRTVLISERRPLPGRPANFDFNR